MCATVMKICFLLQYHLTIILILFRKLCNKSFRITNYHQDIIKCLLKKIRMKFVSHGTKEYNLCYNIAILDILLHLKLPG